MESERHGQDQPGPPVGKRALLDCLSFLQDLEVQIADDPSRMEEMKGSVLRRNLLLPCVCVDANIGEANTRKIMKMLRKRKLKRVDRILQVQRVIQEIIRDFEKSESATRDQVDKLEAPPEMP